MYKQEEESSGGSMSTKRRTSTDIHENTPIVAILVRLFYFQSNLNAGDHVVQD